MFGDHVLSELVIDGQEPTGRYGKCNTFSSFVQDRSEGMDQRNVWNGSQRELVEILAAATMVFIVGVWEHLPTVVPNHYTDIASVFWRNGIGTGPHLVPYFQFTFEYPVLVGFLVYAASSIRLYVPDFSTALNYYVLAMDAVLYLFTVGTVIVVYRMVHLIGVEKARIWKAFLIAPSFLMFTVYNWDIVAIFFSTLSIYCHLKGDKTKSVLSLGFGIAAKLYPCMLIPVFMLEESNWKGRLKALLAPVAVFVLLNLPFILANFSGWLETWTYHAGWGIEDSWLIFIFNQMDPNAHYFALAVLLYLVYRGVTGTLKKQYKDRPTRVIERSFLMNIAWLFGNYVVTPQMALMLLPFYVLIPAISLPVIYLAEIMNALVIVLWFSSPLNLGNPLAPTSPVQWFAAGRQLIWLGLFIKTIYPTQTRNFFRTLTRSLGEPVPQNDTAPEQPASPCHQSYRGSMHNAQEVFRQGGVTQLSLRKLWLAARDLAR